MTNATTPTNELIIHQSKSILDLATERDALRAELSEPLARTHQKRGGNTMTTPPPSGQAAGNEIRVKCAEAMGKCIHPPSPWIHEGTEGDMELVCTECMKPLRECRPPAYDTSCDAAMELVEALRKEGWSMKTLMWSDFFNKTIAYYTVTFSKGKDHFTGRGEGADVIAQATAIATAFLTTKGLES